MKEVCTLSPRRSTHSSHNTSDRSLRRAMASALTLLFGLTALAMVLYLDRNDVFSNWIMSLGPIGVMMAIVLMAIICLTPLPGEFLLLMDMRVYGVWMGIAVGWAGSIIGALAAFILSRSVGRALIHRFVAPAHLATVESWVTRRQVLGLLAVRMLPIPASAVNYALGMLHTVSLGDYLWTAAVTAIPYYASTGLLYVGIFSRWTVWSIVGVLFIGAVWVFLILGRPIWKEIRQRIRPS